jgi:hypothetical protein
MRLSGSSGISPKRNLSPIRLNGDAQGANTSISNLNCPGIDAFAVELKTLHRHVNSLSLVVIHVLSPEQLAVIHAYYSVTQEHAHLARFCYPKRLASVDVIQ